MSQLRGTLLLAAYTTLTALGFLLVGYDIGVLGGVIVSRSFRESFNHPSASLLGTIVASFEIGALFGSISAVIFGEQLGRTRSTTVGALVVLVGAVFQAASQNVRMLIVARVVCGLGVGIVNSTVPVLQAEISPKATRGLFVCIQLTVLNLGTMLAYWVGYGFTSSKQITGSAQWRIPLALQIVFVIPLLALSHFVVPESPRWLAAHGRIPEAREVLEQLHYDSATAEPGAGGGDAEVDSIITSITDTVKFDEQFGSGRWADIWRLLGREDTVKSRKRLLIACAIQAFQQLGGINAVVYYASWLFLNLGFSARRSNLISGVLFTWYFVASFIPWMLIDSIGRRRLFLVCVSLMSVVLCLQSGFVGAVEKDGNHAMGIAACIMVFLFMGLFTVGFQAVVWVYPAEVLPLRLRAKGTALSTAVNWMCNYLVVLITPVSIRNIGYKTYIIFAVLNASFVPVIYFTFPETKGLSLEEIDKLFSQSGRRSSENSERTPLL